MRYLRRASVYLLAVQKVLQAGYRFLLAFPELAFPFLSLASSALGRKPASVRASRAAWWRSEVCQRSGTRAV